MINSKHEFTFIKSVILQGLTKFKFMEHRASLEPDHPRYMPLHRSVGHRQHERTLLKHVNKLTWFKKENLGDPFRNKWKDMIKYKWNHKTSRGKKSRLNRTVIAGDLVGVKADNDRAVTGEDVVEQDHRIKPSEHTVRSNMKADITTILFVPPSQGSILFKLIVEKEHN